MKYVNCCLVFIRYYILADFSYIRNSSKALSTTETCFEFENNNVVFLALKPQDEQQQVERYLRLIYCGNVLYSTILNKDDISSQIWCVTVQ